MDRGRPSGHPQVRSPGGGTCASRLFTPSRRLGRGCVSHPNDISFPSHKPRLLDLAIDSLVTNSPALVQRAIVARVDACRRRRKGA